LDGLLGPALGAREGGGGQGRAGSQRGQQVSSLHRSISLCVVAERGQGWYGQGVEGVGQGLAASRLVADLLEQQQRQAGQQERLALGAGLADGAGALGVQAIAGLGGEGG